MRHTRTKSLAVSAFFVLLSLMAQVARAQDERSHAVAPNALEIAYTVSMRRPHTHMLEVEARLRYANAAPTMRSTACPFL